MTILLVSVSCNILGIDWDKHHQTFVLSINLLGIRDNHECAAVVHLDITR